MKTGDQRSFYLKVKDPENLQAWAQKIQQILEKMIAHPREYFLSLTYQKEIGNNYLLIQSKRTKKEFHWFKKHQSFLHPLEVETLISLLHSSGKSTCNVRWLNRTLNKQGKDYSRESASTIQKEYIAHYSTRESQLEKSKRIQSAHNILEAEERIQWWPPLLLESSLSPPPPPENPTNNLLENPVTTQTRS